MFVVVVVEIASRSSAAVNNYTAPVALPQVLERMLDSRGYQLAADGFRNRRSGCSFAIYHPVVLRKFVHTHGEVLLSASATSSAARSAMYFESVGWVNAINFSRQPFRPSFDLSQTLRLDSVLRYYTTLCVAAQV